jgi:hypothetical protein
MKNTYFPNIPLALEFQFSNTTAFQKIFFLRVRFFFLKKNIFAYDLSMASSFIIEKNLVLQSL